MNRLFNSIKARLLKFIWDECGSILGIFAIIGPTAVLITLGATDFTKYQITQNQVVSQMLAIGNFINSNVSSSTAAPACANGNAPDSCASQLNSWVSTLQASTPSVLPTKLAGFTYSVRPVVYCSGGTIVIPTNSNTSASCPSGNTASSGYQTNINGSIKAYVLGYFFSGSQNLTLAKTVVTITAGVTGESGTKTCAGVMMNDTVASKIYDRVNNKYLDNRSVRLKFYDGSSNVYTNQNGDSVSEQYQLAFTDWNTDTVKSHKYSELSNNFGSDRWSSYGSSSHYHDNNQIGYQLSMNKDSNYVQSKTITDPISGHTKRMDEWNAVLMENLQNQVGTTCMMTVFKKNDTQKGYDYYTMPVTISNICRFSEWDGTKHASWNRDHTALDSNCGNLGTNPSYLAISVDILPGVQSDGITPRASAGDSQGPVRGAGWALSDKRPTNGGLAAAGAYKGNEHVALH
ncbi:hypothetical protein [Polynucleobacter sp. UB-Tiil-W10]|uniref:hypothetical protein n=1 Tax=Polynucleobacter sp. UB-Tiil-W10 TaxID=1855648 RepID=UPI001C0BFDE0|nr:hypothetical protein [Polynucleobacter sp. UB-Tiil-W10]MBU3541645.1 hypothetical protein [Polynucleobacter sp. UB-Tiil-W10]